MRRTLSLLLSAALLLGALSACRRETAPEDEPVAPSSSSVSSGSSTGRRPAAESTPVSEPEPEPEPVLEFDPDYTLDISYPKVSKGGLELPVIGATGYASVQLGLWEEIPPEPEPPEIQPEEPSGTAPEGETNTGPAPQPPDTSVTEQNPNEPTNPSSQEPAPPASSQEPAPPASSQEPSSPSGSTVAEETVTPPDTSTAVQDPNAAEPDPSSQEPVSPDAGVPVEPDTSPDTSAAGQDPSAPPPDPSSQEPPPDASAPGETVTPPDTSAPVQDPSTTPPDPSSQEPLPEEPEPEPDPFEGALAVLAPGTAFVILAEEQEEGWWRVRCKEGEGWVENRFCLINLPDVIPSMVYNATNSYSSRFVTLGQEIPNVTGKAFYPGSSYNKRLEREEFMMPVLYPMARHICQAQQAALAQGNTLVLYEGYRPHSVQTAVYRAMADLSRKDSAVNEAVASPPWNLSWFIAGGYSNHQRGFAIDVTLAQIQKAEVQQVGRHSVLRVLEYEEYTMPTPIHELSKAAATFVKPVASHSPTAWKSAGMMDSMAENKPALALQAYCTGAGLTPLASEWWHFNDLDTRTLVLENLSTGGYKISQCLSVAP